MQDFYSLTHNGFVKRKGNFVPNDLGFELYAYHSDETIDFEKGTWWYVVEATSGLAAGKGRTKAKAIELALESIEQQGYDVIKKMVDASIDKYGMTPDHRPCYL